MLSKLAEALGNKVISFCCYGLAQNLSGSTLNREALGVETK
ncbi:hypothetical protein [Dulcicalothrix desertica]|nr:hypothetical protein [Dulcicalothrix desertica]